MKILKSNIIKLTISVVFLVVFAFINVVSAIASPPYSTYSFNADRQPAYMQTVYQPVGMLGQNLYDHTTGEQLPGLSNPSGIFIDQNDRIYVADRDNNRIVHITSSGALMKVYGDESGPGVLRQPEGVFVTENGDVFVADTGNNRIVHFDAGGNYIFSFGKPDDIRLQNIMFIPTDVTMDLRGTLLVLLRGGSEGIMLMSREGEFLSFFGRNLTPLNIIERLLRFIYTDEQIRTNLNRLAPSPSAVAVGKDGFIYTATQATDRGQLKKLNVNSEDLFLNEDFQIDNPYFNPIALSAITVTNSGMIFVTDRSNGMVLIHDNLGDLQIGFGQLLFGGNFRVGVFGDPVGIGVNSRYNVFVLDRVYNGIHVFAPTNFMLNFIAGIEKQQQGLHLEAEENWETVLRQNVFIRSAHEGIGRIRYREGDYISAMEHMRRAFNQELYSAARWQQRVIVTREYTPVVLITLAGVFILWLILFKILRLKMEPTRRVMLGPRIAGHLHNFLFAAQILRSPSDTLYSASYEKHGNIGTATVWLLLYLMTAIIATGLTSFSFSMYGLRGFDLVTFLVFNLLPVLVWILAGYLVGSITKGQGTLRNIFISTVYALMPFILLRIPIALISQVLTLTEVAIYNFFMLVMWAWVVILQFIATKETQGFSMGETVKNTLWIIFVSAMTVLFAIALYGIAMQAWSFLDEFFRELLGLV